MNATADVYLPRDNCVAVVIGSAAQPPRRLLDPRGPLAVDLALAAGAGAYFTGIPLWRGLREEIRRARSLRGVPAPAQGQHQPGDGDQSGGRLGHRGRDLAGRAPRVLVQVGQRSQRADIDVRVEHHGHHGTA